MAPADGGVFGRGFNEFSVFRVVGASLTPHPLSPRLGPCSRENNPSFLGLTSVNGSGEEVLGSRGGWGWVCVGQILLTLGRPQKLALQWQRPPIRALSESQKRGWLGGNGGRMPCYCPCWGSSSGPPGRTPTPTRLLTTTSDRPPVFSD